MSLPPEEAVRRQLSRVLAHTRVLYGQRVSSLRELHALLARQNAGGVTASAVRSAMERMGVRAGDAVLAAMLGPGGDGGGGGGGGAMSEEELVEALAPRYGPGKAVGSPTRALMTPQGTFPGRRACRPGLWAVVGSWCVCVPRLCVCVSALASVS